MHPDELVQHHTQRFEDISDRIGEVELKMASVQQTVGRIKTDLYNGDDDPEKGHAKTLSGLGRAAAAPAAALSRYRKPPATRASGAAFSRRAIRLLSALT